MRRFTFYICSECLIKCPAARQGLKWTKCPAVRNFHRISTERFFQTLMIFDVSLEMQGDSKNYRYVRLQDDEITELVHTIKPACA